MSDELKRCPFCGGEASMQRFNASTTSARIICQCGIELRAGKGQSVESIVEQWNARAAVADEQFAMAVHDGRVWQVVRECHAVLKSKLCYLPDDPPEVDEFHECSECGEVFPYGPEGYCPRCGAKVAAVGIMRLITLYDEEGAEGIECSKCGWSEIHGWDESMPGHCPGCGAKIEGESR